MSEKLDQMHDGGDRHAESLSNGLKKLVTLVESLERQVCEREAIREQLGNAEKENAASTKELGRTQNDLVRLLKQQDDLTGENARLETEVQKQTLAASANEKRCFEASIKFASLNNEITELKTSNLRLQELNTQRQGSVEQQGQKISSLEVSKLGVASITRSCLSFA